MKKTLLGGTEILVSRLGLGTVKLGRNQGVSYPTTFNLPTEKEILSLLSFAKDLGINLLDTAPAYGHSEERLGKLLKGERQNWVISTKAGEQFINGKSYFDFTPSALLESVENSLNKLKTDYLDIVLIHSNGEDKKLIEQFDVLNTLTEIKKSGKIRAIGMSTKTVEGGLLAVEMCDVLMVTYNIEYKDEENIIQRAHEINKGILIKKALAGGHINFVQDALQFVFKKPGVSSVILGTLNKEHLAEAANVLV